MARPFPFESSRAMSRITSSNSAGSINFVGVIRSVVPEGSKRQSEARMTSKDSRRSSGGAPRPHSSGSTEAGDVAAFRPTLRRARPSASARSVRTTRDAPQKSAVRPTSPVPHPSCCCRYRLVLVCRENRLSFSLLPHLDDGEATDGVAVINEPTHQKNGTRPNVILIRAAPALRKAQRHRPIADAKGGLGLPFQFRAATCHVIVLARSGKYYNFSGSRTWPT